MIDKYVEKLLNQAFAKANQARFEFFTTEHMLLTLCQHDTGTREALTELGADITELIESLENFLEKNCPKLINEQEGTNPTSAFHRVVERATAQRRSAGKAVANGIHLIISMMEESHSYATYYLRKQGIKQLSLMHFVSRNEPDTLENANDSTDNGEHNEEENPLSQYASNLNELAMNGQIDPLIGRESELERTIQVLSRRRKNNPILVGEAGVGKTAIAEGLAKKIVDGEVPKILAKTTIYSIDLGSLVAGSKYRGDFEKRVKALMKQLAGMKNAVVFIDEIHNLLGAGATSESTLDASNLLKPALSSGQLRCIGATTYKEYKSSFEKNAALARRFQKIDIVEPSKSETVDILKGLLPSFEQFHEVKYQRSSIEHAVDLADKYIHDRFLPDKAIDLIDEAGAKAKIQIPRKKRINNKDIESVLAKIAKIPEKTLSTNEKQVVRHLEKRLQKLVFGQDQAIEALVSAIKLSHAGLKDIEKPIGSFLFAGPTGVGKTEVSKKLAQLLGVNFLRFDMSEYMEAHSVSRLIGSPPGYVGYDEGGLLTDAVANTPHCVLLLDEIEKAHPDIFNLLLQIMDYGKLTDSNGKSVNFSHVILIMTSNVGASRLEKNSMGFTLSEEAHQDDLTPALKRAFTPEFRNRLTDVIPFATLPKTVVLKIIDKLIGELAEKLRTQHITISITPTAKQWLLDNGYNPLMGARPMSRLIDKKIKKPLSEMILFGELRKGGEAKVVWDKKSAQLNITAVKPVAVK